MTAAASENYTYKYVRQKLKGGSWNGQFSQAYQEIIDAHAQDGWRFVQAFAPAIVGYGAASYVDLIFERRVT